MFWWKKNVFHFIVKLFSQNFNYFNYLRVHSYRFKHDHEFYSRPICKTDTNPNQDTNPSSKANMTGAGESDRNEIFSITLTLTRTQGGLWVFCLFWKRGVSATRNFLRKLSNFQISNLHTITLLARTLNTISRKHGFSELKNLSSATNFEVDPSNFGNMF